MLHVTWHDLGADGMTNYGATAHSSRLALVLADVDAKDKNDDKKDDEDTAKDEEHHRWFQLD